MRLNSNIHSPAKTLLFSICMLQIGAMSTSAQSDAGVLLPNMDAGLSDEKSEKNEVSDHAASAALEYSEAELKEIAEMGGVIEDISPTTKTKKSERRQDEIELEGELVDATSATETTILGNRKARKRIAGSAHSIGKKELEKLKYDDINRILKGVPGVYLREEDGFGLRPNIGLRGASADRSAKITLLEDGVLFGPAPYAAPAAYFFPLTTRMVGVEVFKGPSAVQYGPFTVGGALNLKTRRIPSNGTIGGIDLAAGSFRNAKGHAYLGFGGTYGGVLVEGAGLSNAGFKQLDGRKSTGLWDNGTGFNRADLMVKARLNTRPSTRSMHFLEAKFGYGSETSQETYLGISDADFAQNPWRRYLGSSKDLLIWNRTQAELRYRFFFKEDFDVEIVAYKNDFTRSWRKIDRFSNGLSIRDVLQNPDVGSFGPAYDLLTGARDSASTQDGLELGTNDRTYASQGIQFKAHYRFSLFGIRQDLIAGARFHNDSVNRNQFEETYLVQYNALVRGPSPLSQTTLNRGEATALALYLQDEISWGPLLLVPGIRVELIETQLTNFLNDNVKKRAWSTDITRFSAGGLGILPSALSPGLGAYWQVFDAPIFNLGLLAGVHKGFSPVAPGQDDDVQPEESLNGELGFRAGSRTYKNRIEMVGFYSYYNNLTTTCTFSTGCLEQNIDTQFQAAAVHVGGLEFSAHQDIVLPFHLRASFAANYTFTATSFASAFDSKNQQWGSVDAGDELPYVPAHQAALVATGYADKFTLTLSSSYVSQMRDVAGQGEFTNGTQDAFIIDALLNYTWSKQISFYMRGDNLTNQKRLVSRRPFGARSGKPLHVMLGIKAQF